MDYSLVIAAAHAAGPCPPGEEPAWGRRVHALTVDLHLIANQAAQDISRLDSASRFVAFLEGVEIEESSRRGLLTLRSPAGDSEHIRTEQQETDRGRDLIERARALQGRWVLVFRYNEKASATKQVRMLAHLMDLGDGAIAVNLAKKILTDDAAGVVPRAQAAWAEAGLPDAGAITVEQLERARARLKDA
ncbi:hypothetical protein ABZV87_28035 [Streptomyces tendae]|uniref:hypothetical protein n=1 Tax=Streptomyces TaxID=1883 RepID=UPI001B390328|nr:MULTISPECIES: hypothetical protein [unclassified Streptomyces]MBQ0967459.1 hypothetical protein [Streptomyces sp. RK74B]MBQ1008010.1 hypothetical protein [Streptomyces sp. RK23]